MPPEDTLDARRQAAQLAFIASGLPLTVGNHAATPFDVDDLRSPQPRHAELRINRGLSAVVLRLNAGGRLWTLKQARPEARVRNVDGQTAFLNEIQRRLDHAELKLRDPQRWQGLVDTAWGAGATGCCCRRG